MQSFEQKYYNMEYRIKSQKQGYGHSDSSESLVDWAVLDEQVFERKSDLVGLGHIFGPGNGDPRLADDSGGGEEGGYIEVVSVFSRIS